MSSGVLARPQHELSCGPTVSVTTRRPVCEYRPPPDQRAICKEVRVMARHDSKDCTPCGTNGDDEARVLEAMRSVRQAGGQAWNGPRPVSAWIEHREYEIRVRRGRPQYREKMRRGRWSNRSPTEQYLDDELRKYRAAHHRVLGQARASAAGVTARRAKAAVLEDAIVAMFESLRNGNRPMPVRNRTGVIARRTGKTQKHVLDVLRARGLR